MCHKNVTIFPTVVGMLFWSLVPFFDWSLFILVQAIFGLHAIQANSRSANEKKKVDVYVLMKKCPHEEAQM